MRCRVDGNLLSVERHGRYRYFRLAGPHVADLLETAARFAPAQPIRSPRKDTGARHLRLARTCDDHLAGCLGVSLRAAMLRAGQLTGGDGTFDPKQATDDRLSAAGHDIDYALSDAGRALFADLGVAFLPRRRHPILPRLDRTAAGLLNRLVELDWVRRTHANRAVVVTAAGRAGLAEHFNLDWPSSASEGRHR